MMRRTTTLAAGLLAAAAALWPAAPATAQEGCTIFTSKDAFEQFNASDGKVFKGTETFEEAEIPDGGKQPLPAPLEGNVPNVDPDTGFGFPQGLTEKNIIIQDNLTQGPAPPDVNPSGDPAALYVIGPGFSGSNSKKVGEDLFLQGIWASLDLIFTEPNHTGVGFELSRFDQFPVDGWTITVYNKNEVPILVFDVPPPPNNEPGKTFVGVWCEETIGRINIFDLAGPVPDAVDNIQMWTEQEPVCPWDCALPIDKTVGTPDFLALLAGWGLPGPCDFDGGGVGTPDFLELLAHWGPCPTPVNDECGGALGIIRTDVNQTLEVHFDMYGATPSPEPYQCIPGIDPIFKDIWYCLQNGASEPKLVTLSSSVDLLIEVTTGCVCPPGPLVTCGHGAVGTPQFLMQPGELVTIRLVNDLNLPNDQIKGNLVIQNKPVPPDDVNFFADPALFLEQIQLAGKVSKLFWDFKPHVAPGGKIVKLDDPLNIDTHQVNPGDPWTDAAGNDLWPPEVDNVTFSSNQTPQGPLTPSGPGGLGFVQLDNNVLFANNPDDSFDIISGPPAGDNHTAAAFEMLSFGGALPPVLHVTVYDKNDVELGKFTVTADQTQKVFVGVITKDPDITIGRIDIWDESGGLEGISSLEMFQQPVPTEEVNLFLDPAQFDAALQKAGKLSKFLWNFKPHAQPTVPVRLDDPLDISTHNADPDDPWTDDSGLDLWPPEVDNVQFVSNTVPQGPLDPAGIDGLLFVHPGSFPIENNALLSNFPENSFDIVSGPPAGDNHTAFALELISVGAAGPQPAIFHVTVYDKNDQELGKFLISSDGAKVFAGLLTKDPTVTIGRIDVWDELGGQEGISLIQAYLQQDVNPFGCPQPGDCCQPHPSPGCDNTDCCRRVCQMDPFCCDAEWDPLCVEIAQQLPQCDCPEPALCPAGTRIDFGVTPDDFGNANACPGPIAITTQYVQTQSIVFGTAVDNFNPPGVAIQDDAACAPTCRSAGQPPFASDWWCQFRIGAGPGQPGPLAGVTDFSAQLCFIDAPAGTVLMEGYNNARQLIATAANSTTGSETLSISAPAGDLIAYVHVIATDPPKPAGVSVDCLSYPDPIPRDVPHEIEPCPPGDCPPPDEIDWCVYQVDQILDDPGGSCDQRGIFPGALICVARCPFPGDPKPCLPDPTSPDVTFRVVGNGCLFRAVSVSRCENCPPDAAQFNRIN